MKRPEDLSTFDLSSKNWPLPPLCFLFFFTLVGKLTQSVHQWKRDTCFLIKQYNRLQSLHKCFTFILHLPQSGLTICICGHCFGLTLEGACGSPSEPGSQLCFASLKNCCLFIMMVYRYLYFIEFFLPVCHVHQFCCHWTCSLVQTVSACRLADSGLSTSVFPDKITTVGNVILKLRGHDRTSFRQLVADWQLLKPLWENHCSQNTNSSNVKHFAL